MGEVVAAGRNPSRIEKKKRKRKRETMLEKKKENKRKKQARDEIESVEKRKEQLEKEEEKQWSQRIDKYELEKEKLEKRKEELKKREEKLKKTKNQLMEETRTRIAEYWGRVWKSDGFDIEGLVLETYLGGMQAYVCKKPNDCPILVSLYAKIGLHRYNMLQEANLQLRSIKKYNTKSVCGFMPASYYITLEAVDPATGSVAPFQVSSHERCKSDMDVRFIVARPQETGTNGMVFRSNAPGFYNIPVPEWPSENDQKQFYLVQESELKENDWIRLYLELEFVTTNRRIPDPKLSDLKIVEVMVDTKENVEQPNERLKGFKDAVVYIKYDQDLGEGQVCKRRAIIRRAVDLRTGHMSLKGHHHSLQVKIDDSENAA
uniref:UPF0725 protein n=1 Tax=Noccaea caerulescens TaxID=107243 RepID=A0A1J3HIW6_NOCCA